MLEHDLRAETAQLLADLIRIDTTNPPGNETPAAEHLAAYLAESGVEAALRGRVPERTNLVARLHGTGDGPSLMLLGHTDVVLADRSEWSVEPFSGLERDGHIWGRGALDMKGQVAAEAVAFATLAREGWTGAGDLIYCAVAAHVPALDRGRGRRSPPTDGARAVAEPAAGRDDRADARRDDRPDGDERQHEDQRDPGPCTAALRLPHPAGHVPGRHRGGRA